MWLSPLVSFFLLCICFVGSYDNGVGRVSPSFGFTLFSSCPSWGGTVGRFPTAASVDLTNSLSFLSRNQFGCSVSEELILDTAKGLKQSNLDKVGYEYVNIDDCWQLPYRDKSGHVLPDPKLFPRGMKPLADELHSMGLKLGLYTDIGIHTCQKRAGSYGFYAEDAQTYADWGIDYIKIDFCYTVGSEGDTPWVYYGNFSHWINQTTEVTKRPVVLSICNWGVKDPWKWAPAISNSWRTTGDISPVYSRMISNMQNTRVLGQYSSLYSYNDPDMLEVGVVRGSEKLSQDENRAHYSLWCLMSAPLLLGNDLRKIDPDVLEIIANAEVIAVSQDETGIQGEMTKEETHGLDLQFKCQLKTPSFCKWIQIWKKQLVGGKVAVLLFNLADPAGISQLFEAEQVAFAWSDIGLRPEDEYDIRDLWEKKDLGKHKGLFTFPEKIRQHAAALLLLTPTKK